jgi:hypothetical protein
MLRGHPSAQELEGFMQGRSTSDPAARNMVLRHLLAACPHCWDELLAAGWTTR